MDNDLPPLDFGDNSKPDYGKENADLPELDFGDKETSAPVVGGSASQPQQPQYPTMLGIPTDPMLGYNMMKSASMGIGQAGMNIVNKIGETVHSSANKDRERFNKLLGTNAPTEPYNPIATPEAFKTENAPIPETAKFAEEIAPAMIPYVGERAAIGKGLSMLGKVAPKAIEGAEGFMGKLGAGAARAGVKGLVRGAYGTAGGAIAEAASNANASKEDIVHGAKVMAIVNAALPQALEGIPGVSKSIINIYKSAAAKDKAITGGVRSPEQARQLVDEVGQDILSFPDLVKAPKLSSAYHAMLKYMPFAGIKKMQREAVGRLEEDAGKIWHEKLGRVNDNDEVLARKIIGSDIKKYAEEQKDELQPKFTNLMEAADARGAQASKTNVIDFAKKEFAQHKKYEEKGESYLASDELTKVKQLLGMTKEAAKKGKSKEEEIDELVGKTLGKHTAPELREKFKEKIKTTIGTPEEEDNVSGAPFTMLNDSWRKLKEEASDLMRQDKRVKARFKYRLADAYQKDIETSLKKSGHYDLYEDLMEYNKEWQKKVVPFEKSEDATMRSFINKKDGINYNTTQLEEMARNSQNEKAFAQLPAGIQEKLFARILNNKVDEKLNTRAEKLADAYKKLNDYEKALIHPETQRQFENLIKRVDLLEPVLAKASKAWKNLYKAKTLGYMAGVSLMGLASGAPIALPLIVGSAAARLLKSKKLMNAYMGRSAVPGEKIPSLGGVVGRGTAAALGGFTNNHDNSY